MQNVIKSFDDYQKSYQESLNNPEQYWSKSASNYHWYSHFERTQSGSFHELDVAWFVGGKTNLSYNCIDRYLEKNGEKTAVIWIEIDPARTPTKITFNDLHNRVNTFAASLKSLGVEKGDRVCFYMGMVPELLVGI